MRKRSPASSVSASFACALVALFAFVAGCAKSPGITKTTGRTYPIRIVTTTAMVTDIVKAVVGNHATVVGLLGEGVDPHLYKPTRNDVQELGSADVIFYSGKMLEGRMADTFARVQRSGTPAIPVADGIAESELMEPPGLEGHWDPHIWMDVQAWSQCVEYVAQEMAKFDPANAEDYRSNADQYRAQLAELDNYVRQVIASIPESQRVLVTAHDAFGYFSRAYDIPVHSVQGISTESEASVNDINRLVDRIVSQKIKAIFVESSVSERNMRAIVEGAASRGWQVEIGGELFSDAMGRPGTYEGTYIGMLDHNATTIARALGGDAPARGMVGKLSEQ